MAYMSYCRFEGTASDFGECIEDLKKGKVLNQYEEPYRHTLYKTVLHIIEDMGKAAQVITGSLAFPAYCALQYWSRMSEFSADRCAAAVVGERTFQSAFLKLTSGLTNIQGNPYQLVEQAKAYHDMTNRSFLSRVQQACRVALYSHPQNCERAYEIDRWKSSAIYRKLTSNLQIDA